MPTYDYECKKCGKKFEFFQKMSDAKLAVCPENICEDKGDVVRKVGTGTGFIFNAVGFYKTDYKK